MHSFHLLAGFATACIILAANFYLFFKNDLDVSSIVPLHRQEETERLLDKTRQLEHALDYAKAKASSAASALSSVFAEATATPQLENTATKLVSSLPYPEDVSSFAYIFYATQNAYACAALVNIARLRALNITIAIHVLLATTIDKEYKAAFAALNTTVHVQAIPHPSASTADHPSSLSAGYYANCWLKLVGFRMHHLDPSLKRVLILDSDQLILRNLDNLFTSLPAVDLAAPRAYWLRRHFLSSTFMLVNLSDRLWSTVNTAMQTAGQGEFDMDLVNRVLGNTSMVLGGEYVMLNFHWETWSLPDWYHGVAREGINWTTVNMVNELARERKKQGAQLKRQDAILVADEHVPSTLPGTTADLPPAQGTRAGILDTAPLASPQTLPSNLPTAQDSSAAPGAATQLSPSVNSPQAPILPRFPATHPLSLALDALRKEAALIHFTAVGKPWQFTASAVRRMRPDAHPALAKMVEEWRVEAGTVCPRWDGGAGLG